MNDLTQGIILPNSITVIGHVISDEECKLYESDGYDMDDDMTAQYNICIPHEYTDDQRAMVDLGRVKEIVKGCAPEGTEYKNIDVAWFDAKKILGRQMDELSIEIIVSQHRIDGDSMVQQVNGYMDECVFGIDQFTDAVNQIPDAAEEMQH